MSKPRQQTITEAVELEGAGLHTGARVRLRLLPAPVNAGIRLRRVDLEGSPEIPAQVSQVSGTDRGTTLGAGEAQVHTVEHLLSAVAAREIERAVFGGEGAAPREEKNLQVERSARG